MNGAMLRSLALGAALSFAVGAHADSNPLSAELRCARASAPGRIVCELTTRSAAGKLAWSDALVVQAPAFARALRSRVMSEAGMAKLALVASAPGTGTLEVLVRAVICEPGGTAVGCRPYTRKVSAVIEVGANLP